MASQNFSRIAVGTPAIAIETLTKNAILISAANWAARKGHAAEVVAVSADECTMGCSCGMRIVTRRDITRANNSVWRSMVRSGSNDPCQAA